MNNHATNEPQRDEDIRTLISVNEAARESAHDAKEGKENVPTYGDLEIPPSAPDFKIHAGAAHGVYYYRSEDTAEKLSFTACGKVPMLPDHAALIYGIVNALSSISNRTIGLRLCERFGYKTVRDARASGKQVKVIIHTADPALVEFGNIFAEAENPRLYQKMLGEDDKLRYKELAAQCSRFETCWKTVDANVTVLTSAHQWANDMLQTVSHDGAVRSFASRINKSS